MKGDRRDNVWDASSYPSLRLSYAGVPSAPAFRDQNAVSRRLNRSYEGEER